MKCKASEMFGSLFFICVQENRRVRRSMECRSSGVGGRRHLHQRRRLSLVDDGSAAGTERSDGGEPRLLRAAPIARRLRRDTRRAHEFVGARRTRAHHGRDPLAACKEGEGALKNKRRAALGAPLPPLTRSPSPVVNVGG